MSAFRWNLKYLLKKTRWDTGITPPELVEVVETGPVHVGRALDIGCLHSLDAEQRQSYAAMLRRVVNDGGFFFLYT